MGARDRSGFAGKMRSCGVRLLAGRLGNEGTSPAESKDQLSITVLEPGHLQAAIKVSSMGELL